MANKYLTENMYVNDRQELLDYIKTHSVKTFEPGREGVCNLLDNGQVVKYLHDEYNPKFVFQFSDLDIPSFIFTKTGAFLHDYVIALFMDYAKGEDLSQKRPDDQSIITLGDQLTVLEKDIEKASDRGVLVRDFHCGNIKYDETEGFKVIDTLPYLRMPSGRIYMDNIYEVMNKLYACLLKDIISYKPIFDKYAFYGKSEYLKNPREYLLTLKGFIQELVEQEINTLGEANQALQMKFKK